MNNLKEEDFKHEIKVNDSTFILKRKNNSSLLEVYNHNNQRVPSLGSFTTPPQAELAIAEYLKLQKQKA